MFVLAETLINSLCGLSYLKYGVSLLLLVPCCCQGCCAGPQGGGEGHKDFLFWCKQIHKGSLLLTYHSEIPLPR